MNAEQIKLAAEMLKQSVSMADICNEYNLPVNKGGFICCPFHRDLTPSMKVYPGSGGYYCYACHEGGDVIRFVSKLNGTSFADTIKDLCRIFLPNLSLDDDLSAAELAALRKKNRSLAQEKAQKEARLAAAESRYHTAMDTVIQYDIWLNVYCPGLNEEPNARYTEAARNIDAACYRLSEAETELNRAQKRRWH